jgi:hypothetical protein
LEEEKLEKEAEKAEEEAEKEKVTHIKTLPFFFF